MPRQDMLPEPLIYGDVPAEVQKMAKEFASKLLVEHQHCLVITDMRYSVIPNKEHGSYEFLARIFHDSSIHSCTHKATFSLGTDPDAHVPHLVGQAEGTPGLVQP